MEALTGGRGPSVGTKMAIYPECPRPEPIRGLREHTDAGCIILMLQEVPGLEFFKDGKSVKIPRAKNNRICINTECFALSHGYEGWKQTLHCHLLQDYNPAGDTIISPSPKLLLPNHFRFQDYLDLYTRTKFEDKALRFESLKSIANRSNHVWYVVLDMTRHRFGKACITRLNRKFQYLKLFGIPLFKSTNR
ncbi:1-aminocyclopropane-1-carboxylate oxidase 1 [Olea europaea subsp. europaea]|uniref:1-aminocyclopropane-1-carboxylate oxidase 1 n=1 Tax=Olea europaea subsp. europaea TaxID=158383 RepID=A0A8S0U8D0_OLEEU|nr:1-aminocyclopropane-1-carboxylate oxidase 1 [Olea europaea subsp. europaea]